MCASQGFKDAQMIGFVSQLVGELQERRKWRGVRRRSRGRREGAREGGGMGRGRDKQGGGGKTALREVPVVLKCGWEAVRSDRRWSKWFGL